MQVIVLILKAVINRFLKLLFVVFFSAPYVTCLFYQEEKKLHCLRRLQNILKNYKKITGKTLPFFNERKSDA